MPGSRKLYNFLNQPMIRLPESFKKYCYSLKLVRRCENKAIYAQFWGSDPIAFEVIKIRKRLRKYNKLFKQEQPESEVYPSSEQWGKSAWTYRSWETALAKYNSI